MEAARPLPQILIITLHTTRRFEKGNNPNPIRSKKTAGGKRDLNFFSN